MTTSTTEWLRKLEDLLGEMPSDPEAQKAIAASFAKQLTARKPAAPLVVDPIEPDDALEALERYAQLERDGQLDEAGHQIVTAAQALVGLQAADEDKALLEILIQAPAEAVQVVAAQLAFECVSAAWVPKGEAGRPKAAV